MTQEAERAGEGAAGSCAEAPRVRRGPRVLLLHLCLPLFCHPCLCPHLGPVSRAEPVKQSIPAFRAAFCAPVPKWDCACAAASTSVCKCGNVNTSNCSVKVLMGTDKSLCDTEPLSCMRQIDSHVISCHMVKSTRPCFLVTGSLRGLDSVPIANSLFL